MRLAVIDYKAGNIRNVFNAFQALGADVFLARDSKCFDEADALVLPGVGHFKSAMMNLSLMREALVSQVESGKPFLGICLGIQLILSGSSEAQEVEGLNLVEGVCPRFPDSKTESIPHMGWNNLDLLGEARLLEGVCGGDWFYFVHSFYPQPADDSVVGATTRHIIDFASVIECGNIYATQFHPEKSAQAGQKILGNFLSLVKK
ncbi:MAG: imidazole glycerol phosphate synthase subunit HisH [Candidatus Altiarchaeales archaeon]|nr:imidazole glycerol phosphate synthase subunit HisH [Candidatus Altiarchaeales archaeon]